MTNHQAIFATHPNITIIRGDEAFDAEGNPVVYDKDAVQRSEEHTSELQSH